MSLSDLLGIRRGERVAVVGAGGKTALIDRLADENAPGGVLIAPTARIALSQIRERPGVRYLGRAEGDKLIAAPLDEIEAASQRSALTLMEADGSMRLPLKGWAAHEPAVPDFATLTIGIASARAVGLAANEANVHRLPLFLEQVGLAEGDMIDAAALARMIQFCMNRCQIGRGAILINQADDPAAADAARRVARSLRISFRGQIWIGSMREGRAWIAN